MFFTKVYLYDSSQEENGYRGVDFSKNVLQGDENTEDITQLVDTSEITLCGLNRQEEFVPGTKFIIDLIETDNLMNESIVETLHRVVSIDIVEKPILSDNSYFNHHISLDEPSVVAQQRLVDNISSTYLLKDVKLEEVAAVPDTNATVAHSQSVYSHEAFKVHSKDYNSGPYEVGKYFQLEGDLKLLDKDGNVVEKEFVDIERFTTDGVATARFQLPKIAIRAGLTSKVTPAEFQFWNIGYASLDYVINEFLPNAQDTPTGTWSGTIISNSRLDQYNRNTNSTIPFINDRIYEENRPEWLVEKVDIDVAYTDRYYSFYLKKYTDISAPDPTYITADFPIREDRVYKVTISLHEFPDDINKRQNAPDDWSNASTTIVSYKKWTGGQPTLMSTTSFTLGVGWTTAVVSTDYLQTTATTSYTTYGVETQTIVYSSAIPYTALSLLQKAIINSSIYEKTDGVYIADVNNQDLPFMISNEYANDASGTRSVINDLMSTQVIENFYNQKNLWQIMIEVGHYIHAIPELRFGPEDKFLITFNLLGNTNLQSKSSDKISIHNSRSIEDYICATSSYVSNMVQIGGYIEEWVSPKTIDDTLLVSNDTASIVVSKPIIELLDIFVRTNNDVVFDGETIPAGTVAKMTDFIYEQNVYETLRIDYQVIPNRGIAMFYKLGDNVITGGQFQLPQANTTIYSDYAIKKIIYSAFKGYPVVPISDALPIQGKYWRDLKINDFSFFVKYRTKDSVRQNHIRPDIRKYLLNSKHDRYPEHNQFNNQTDVVVDSIKFGNNIYGTLIKTGNSNYEIVEWNTSYGNVKHKGELYRINGELYYVAKAKHTRHSSFIVSTVTYSKDYNELSSVIGIPSEPRFYEISEQSLIWREFAINDMLLLTDDLEEINYKSNYVLNYDHLSSLMLGEGTDLAKYSITVYKGDKDVGIYDQTIGQPSFYKEVFNPINAYSSENTLTYEWDMLDNYSAGDKVVPISENEDIALDQRAYSSLRAVSYTDIYGRASLLDFYILGDIKIPDGENSTRELSTEEIRNLPESPIKTKNNNAEDTRPFVGEMDILGTNVKEYDENFNGRGIGLLKDCREALSINYNLQLSTNSDTFVLSPFVYSPNKKDVKLVLLSDEVNKLSSGYIDNGTIISPIDNDGNLMNKYFDFDITKNYSANSFDGSKNVVTDFGIDFSTAFSDVSNKHFRDFLLPDEYQQVEYLQNSGTQRIDTEIVPTNSTSIDITYQSLQPTGTSQYIAGARTNQGTTVEYAINGSSANKYWDIRLGGQTATITDVNRTSNKYRSYLNIANGTGTWTLTDMTTGTTYTENILGMQVNTTANLFLFAYNNLDVNTHVNLRIFACKIYDEGVLVRDFIPCYRKADKIAGMYDLVEGKFYSSASGTELIGSTTEINTPVGVQRVKAIAVVCSVPLNTGAQGSQPNIILRKTQFVFARNIPDFWDKDKAFSPVYFGAPNKEKLFSNRQ